MSLINGFEDVVDHIKKQEQRIKELEEENKKLKDFSNWENHPALKHKVVLDDDYYLYYLHEEELIDPEEYEKLKEDFEYQKQISFWRMCESYNGFHKNVCFDKEWMDEMNEMIEEKHDSKAWCEGTVEELQEGYRVWVGYEE